MTVTSKHRSCQLVPKNGISKSAGHLKIPNLYSKFREKICFKYSRFKEKDSNIRIIFELKNCRIRIRIFEIRGKRFESESNPNIFDHLWIISPDARMRYHQGGWAAASEGRGHHSSTGLQLMVAWLALTHLRYQQ